MQTGVYNKLNLLSEQNILQPDDFGWAKMGNKWGHLWAAIAEAAKSCRLLVECGCKAVPKRSTCVSTGLKCTAL